MGHGRLFFKELERIIILIIMIIVNSLIALHRAIVNKPSLLPPQMDRES